MTSTPPTLPPTRTAANTAAASSAVPPFSQTPQKTILYIEDNAANRALVERTLKFIGYRVLTAERGLEGIDLARREQPDLILTDIDLPDLSGRELTTMLRAEARFRATPIVALTAASVGEGRDLTLAAGVDGYLTKPIDVEAFPKQIAFYLDGGRDAIDATSLTDAQRRYAQEIVRRLETRIRELETVNKELNRLDQMKDAFIQITAHELRTPLTLAVGYIRLMGESANLRELMVFDPEVEMLVNGVNSAVSRMSNIINEIVNTSRIVTNQVDLTIGPVNLGELVWRILKEYESAIEARGLHIAFDRAQFPDRMLADWELLNLTFRNLISNAIKYTPDGGTITLRATVEGENVRVSVRDTGIGIEPSQVERIFEHFFSGNNPNLHSTSKTAFMGGGIGLGLALSRGIIEAHGGRLWARSDGRNDRTLPGSEFIVEMPLVTQRLPNGGKGSSSSTPAPTIQPAPIPRAPTRQA